MPLSIEILAEIVLGETVTWDVGPCWIEGQIQDRDSGVWRPVGGGMAEEPDRIAVLGENDALIHEIEAWRPLKRIDREVRDAAPL